MQHSPASRRDPRGTPRGDSIRLHQPPAVDPDPDDADWDAFLPDDEEVEPEPGDFWIEDDDWDDAA